MNILNRFQLISTFVLDIDGVLTNGQVLVQADGSMLRVMHIKDGYALQWAMKQGMQVIVISGASNEPCKIRLERLGILQVHVGVADKAALLIELSREMNIALTECMYMGDDMPDIAAMQLCGIKACPADACVDVQMIADYVSPINGGEGCVRDVIEKVMRLKGLW